MNVRMDETWNYQEAVARRRQKYAEIERRNQAARLFLLQLNAIVQLLVCITLIPWTANYLVDNIDSITSTGSPVVAIVSFVFTQVCCWTYVLCFPQYFNNLE